MAEHLRALAVVLGLGFAYFYATKGALTQILPVQTFARWRNLWLAATLVLFLSHSLWLATVLLGAILLAVRGGEKQVMGLYFVLLFVAPPAPAVIPGLGIIDHVWVLDHYRLLGLTLLLPAAILLLQRSSTVRLGSWSVDWMVLGYLSVLSLLAFREGNVTHGLRTVLSAWVDIFLPYYVASRSIRSMDDFKQSLAGFVISSMLLALVGIFEVMRSWKLYQAVLSALGTNELMFGHYLMRSGLLRPAAAVGNSITLGYLLVVGLGFYLFLKEFFIRPTQRFLGMVVLACGILASLSRGPWVGALVLIGIYVLTGPQPVRRLMKMLLFTVPMIVLLNLVPGGRWFIDMLPFVGTIEQGNVEYRADLITAAWPVIERNLFFGSTDYLDAPELQVAIQGDGIIDIVNTYLGVTLHSGLVGLVFFAGAFGCTLLVVRRGVLRSRRLLDPHLTVLGRLLLAAVATTMVIIYTVSSIGAIPVVYWPLLGLGVAYAALVKELSNPSTEAALP